MVLGVLEEKIKQWTKIVFKIWDAYGGMSLMIF